MAMGKYHVHCGRCGFPIRVASIASVKANPHRKYKCRNCDYLGPPWTFRSAVVSIAEVISDMLDEPGEAAVRKDLEKILAKPHGTLTGVQGFLRKSLGRLEGRIPEKRLAVLVEKVDVKLENDLMGALNDIHIGLLREKSKRKPVRKGT